MEVDATRDVRTALPILATLRAFRKFERRYLSFLDTMVDCDLLCEIAHHQAAGKPLTLKQVFLADLGSVATVQRRLRRLRRLGVIEQTRCPDDRRTVQVTLTPKVLRLLAKFPQSA